MVPAAIEKAWRTQNEHYAKANRSGVGRASKALRALRADIKLRCRRANQNCEASTVQLPLQSAARALGRHQLATKRPSTTMLPVPEAPKPGESDRLSQAGTAEPHI